MSSLTSPAGAIHLGMDTSKNTIVVAILMPGEEVPVIDRMWNEEGSVRHLVGRFPDRAALRACYEAGVAGYSVMRLCSSEQSAHISGHGRFAHPCIMKMSYDPARCRPANVASVWYR